MGLQWLTSKCQLFVKTLLRAGLIYLRSDNAFTTWDITNPSKLRQVQKEVYNAKEPHPHQAVLDPTGKYLLVPDLGMDQIHIYTFDAKTLKFTVQAPVTVTKGNGPRHLALATQGGKTFAYLINELANVIIGYEVTYNNGIQLKQLFSQGTHGKGTTNKKGASGSEIVVSVSASRSS